MTMRPLLTVLALLTLTCRHTTEPLPARVLEKRAKPRITEDKPKEAAQYYAMKRQGTADPHAHYAAARRQMQTMPRYSSSRDVMSQSSLPVSADASLSAWTFLGPGNIGGRTRTLVIDPIDPDVMYAGGVSGGVWKTFNAGRRWQPVGDVLANLAVNSMVMDPRDHLVIYAGTGEGYFREEVRGTALPLRGNGIFVTRDGGSTWQQLNSTRGEDFYWVNDLAISAHDSNRVYAATRTGMWRSDDGGDTWSRVLQPNVRGGCLELAQRSDTSGDYLFASCGTFERATVYRNPAAEGNQAWQPVLSQVNMGRTSLAIAPSEPSTIYALSAALDTHAFLAIHRSDQNGDPGSWFATVTRSDALKLNTLLLENPITASIPECNQGQGTPNRIPMGWYCNVIAVDPSDRERVWVGGVDLFRSDDGGRNFGIASYWWRQAPSFAHADHHAIAFHPRTGSLFSMTDGGVYRSDDRLDPVAHGSQAPCLPDNSQVSFTSLNANFGVTQFYNGAVFPDGRTFIGGAQDNGTLRGSIEGGSDGWEHVWGGDGGYVAINPQNPNIVYAESQYGALVKSVDGGKSFAPLSRRPSDEFLFIPPIAIDALQPSNVWVGGSRLWRSPNDGIEWVPASEPLDGLVSAIAARSNRVLAGTNTGALYRSDDGKTWTRVSPRTGFVSWVAFQGDVAYATYAGFGGTHVWRSLDAGRTWSALDANLPDIPVHAIAIDPSLPTRLFLGTDLGVFVSIDGGQSWAVEITGFAPVVTETVVISGRAVYAFTHGRGVWRSELRYGPRRRAIAR